MDIGLYQLKYTARSVIKKVIPFARDIDPNLISYAMLPLGGIIAGCYFFALNKDMPKFYLLAILLTLFRMFLGTLDGFVAEYYKKNTPKGEIVNRLVPEICDILYLLAVSLADPKWLYLGVIALCIAWMTSFSGLIGLLINKPIQSIGPVGQTDRLVVLMIFSMAAYFSQSYGLGIDFIKIFILWCIFGGITTIIFRLKRTFAC